MKKLIIFIMILFAFSSCSNLDYYQTRPTFYSYHYYGPKPVKRHYFRPHQKPDCYSGYKNIKPYHHSNKPQIIHKPNNNHFQRPKPNPSNFNTGRHRPH